MRRELWTFKRSISVSEDKKMRCFMQINLYVILFKKKYLLFLRYILWNMLNQGSRLTFFCLFIVVHLVFCIKQTPSMAKNLPTSTSIDHILTQYILFVYWLFVFFYRRFCVGVRLKQRRDNVRFKRCWYVDLVTFAPGKNYLSLWFQSLNYAKLKSNWL